MIYDDDIYCYIFVDCRLGQVEQNSLKQITILSY